MIGSALLFGALLLSIERVEGAEPKGSVALPATKAELGSAERRAFLESRWAEWNSLESQEQNSLRSLHEAATAATPQAERVRASLERVDRWLATLSQEERARIIQAKNAEDRLAIIKETLARQTQVLEENLAPGRSLPEGSTPGTPNDTVATTDEPKVPGRRPGSMRPRLDWLETEMKRLEEMEQKFTPEERQRLDEARGGQKLPIMLALAFKYDLPLPPLAEEAQIPITQFFMALVPEVENHLGTRLASALSPENRSKLGAMMVDLVVLPDLNQQRQFDLLQQEEPEIRTGIERIAKVNKTTSRLLTNMLYYSLHPDHAPESARGTLSMVTPEHIRGLIKGGNLRLFGARPIRSDEPNRSPRPDRRPPPSGERRLP
jgi:hypothetical protein